MSEEYDILIRDAFIVDGTSADGFGGAIAVKGKRVAAVGEVKGDARVIIEAEGLTATLGLHRRPQPRRPLHPQLP